MSLSQSCPAWRAHRAFSNLTYAAALSIGVFVTGCQDRSPSVTPISARSVGSVPPSIAQIQSSPLYQQARQACKRQDYRHAAEILQTLAHTPGLPPETVAFCNTQCDLCLKDMGQVPAAPPSPVQPPVDADCGPRALLIVCKQLGVKADLSTLRQTSGTDARGASLEGLQKAARHLGLKAEGVQIDRAALPDITLPALAWVHRDHYVALLALSGSGDQATATLQDPNRATEETISQEQLLQRSGGYLLLVHR